MEKWIAGVTATVVATVLTAFLTDWFGIGREDIAKRETAPTQAAARIVAFNQTGSRIGQPPAAEITVENQGEKTAENCVVYWRSGMYFADGSIPQEVTSEEFALKASESLTVSLSSPVSWTAGGPFEAMAWIICSNTKSPERPKSVFVFPSLK
jgi:hypothetical protein